MKPKRPAQPDQLGDIRNQLHKAIARNLDSWHTIYSHSIDWERGYPTGGGGTGHAVEDSMAEQVVNQLGHPSADPGLKATMWCLRWQRAYKTLLELADQSHELHPKQPKLEDARVSVASVGACDCCERTVARTAADPLLSGLCRNCYNSWTDAKAKKERPQWMKERRLLLGIGVPPNVRGELGSAAS